MQLFIDQEVIVKTTGGYAYLINGNVERPHQTINNIFCIQLLSRGHHNDIWCFCYQYTIWIISHLINRCFDTDIVFLGTSTRTSLTPSPLHTLSSGCEKYTPSTPIKENLLDSHTNTDPRTCLPVIYPFLLPPSSYGFFVGYSNSAKAVIYFGPKTRRIWKTLCCYIDEYGVKLHPEGSMYLG